LLHDLGIDGYVTIGIFGIALLQALATAPSGVAGQIAGLIARLRRLLVRGDSA
jgi:branched-chain amino acid transport system permease protein